MEGSELTPALSYLGRYLSRASREDLRSIVFSRTFNYMTYGTILLYCIVKPNYELRDIMKDVSKDLKIFCYFLFDVNVSFAFTIEV
jgi:hypothetical protein